MPRSSVSASAVRRMCASGVCQRMISGTMLGIRAGLSTQLLILVRVLVQRHDAAGDRVARRVVAADDQQDHVAQIFLRLHVPRHVGMRHHRDQIALGLRVDALVPQPGEIGRAFQQLLALLLLGFDDAAGRGDGGRHVRPARELAPLLEREVEQGRQHLRGELDRDAVDPVEGLAARQLVEDLARTLADRAFEAFADSPAPRSGSPPCAACRAWAGPWR